MLHLHVIVAFSHRCLSARLLWCHLIIRILVLGLTRRYLLSPVATTLLISRFLYACDATSLIRSTKALLLIIRLSVLPELLLMLIEHTRWEAFKNPLVAQAFVRGQALHRVPLQALAYQIDKLGIGHFSKLLHNVFETVIFL